MKLALDNLYPYDTFNLITFSGDEHVLCPEPVPATKDNLRKAQEFLETRQGGGGTEMMKAIKASMDPSDASDHMRIVCFMTDGYVGNDMEIIGEIQKHPNARVFAFGIGGSVNRFLLDGMAKYGRGEVEYVALNDDGSAAARRFHERVRNPLLTDISVDWNGLPVADVYPKQIPDLFGAKPVILSGRYTGAGKGTIRLKGKMSGVDFVREIPVDFSKSESQNDVLSTLWARTRVDDLMSQDFKGAQQGVMKDDIKQAIVQLGLDYRLMTQFTSFVAVEEMIVTDGGQPRRIDVPVEVPEGVNRATAYGQESEGFATFGAMNGRAVSNLYLNPGSVAQTVTVTRSGSNSAKGKRASGSGKGSGEGSGAGTGPGGAGNVGGTDRVSAGGAAGGTSQASASTVKGAPPAATPVRVSSGLFAIDGVSEGDARRPLSPEEQKRAQLQSKFHPSVLAVIDRLKDSKLKASPDEARFIHNGKAEIQIWLTEKSAETLAKLKELGFEVVLDPKTAKLVIGLLPIEKLAAVAELKSVRYVAPRISGN